jgi:Fe-S cluster biosynthesis and repair protein YggX
VGRNARRSALLRFLPNSARKSRPKSVNRAGLNGCKPKRIINHYGLDLTNPEAQGFLMDNMKGFFYGANELAQIDTSKEGSIKW